MNVDNSFYGHGAILARYVGLEGDVPPIWGYLQHGFNLGTGLPPEYRPVRWLRKFLWNRTNARVAAATGMSHVCIIGAPFVYLDRLMRSAHAETGPDTGTIAYPYHSWQGSQVTGSHPAYAATVRARESGPLTACLYWREYAQPEIRGAYENEGFRVICHGAREDPMFLVRLWEEQRRHARVVSNRVGTASWYGAFLQKEVEVYGPAFRATADPPGVDWAEFQQSTWPYLFEGGLGRRQAAEVGAEVLGVEFVREPRELAELLGWTALRVRLATGVRLGVRARRRLLRLDRPDPPKPLPVEAIVRST